MAVPQRSIDRRTILFGGVAAIGVATLPTRLIHATVAQNDDDPTGSGPKRSPAELRETFAQYGFRWSATSPATHQGDEFALTLSNRGDAALKILPRVTIMDHASHYSFLVIEEEFELAAGATRELTVKNDYGVANHFSTNMFVDTGESTLLGVSVTIRDAAGAETASYNERAFWIKSQADIQAMSESSKEGGTGHHDHMPEPETDQTGQS
jgi:hypothetical protein